MINILIVDDHKMFLEGIIAIFRDAPQIKVVAALDTGDKAIEILKTAQIDVLISDLSMPDIDGKELCQITKELSPKTKTLIVTMHDDIDNITALLELGASGYILKNTGKSELITAIEEVYNGNTYYSETVKNIIVKSASERSKCIESSKLTKREVEIIKLIATEFTTPEIAEKLFISMHTVETHRKNIMRKANVRNMAGLIKYALKANIIT